MGVRQCLMGVRQCWGREKMLNRGATKLNSSATMFGVLRQC